MATVSVIPLNVGGSMRMNLMVLILGWFKVGLSQISFGHSLYG